MLKSNQGYGVIFMSFLLALTLTIIPLSPSLQTYNPQWLIIVSSYWGIRSPDKVGIITCWLWGLLLDVSLGTHMGIHAISLAVVSYVTIILHKRLRMYPIWQQSLFIWLVASLDKLVVLQLNSIFTSIDVLGNYWYSTLSSALFWPIVSKLILQIRPKR